MTSGIDTIPWLHLHRIHQSHPFGIGVNILKHRPRLEDGQGLVEYALILVLVAVVVIVILALLGPSINNIFANVLNTVSPPSS